MVIVALLAPIAAQYGIHPIHFGIMFIVNLELGYLTPPMGINLFVASTTFDGHWFKSYAQLFPSPCHVVLPIVCHLDSKMVPVCDIIEVPGLPAFTEQYLIDEQLCQP